MKAGALFEYPVGLVVLVSVVLYIELMLSVLSTILAIHVTSTWYPSRISETGFVSHCRYHYTAATTVITTITISETCL